MSNEQIRAFIEELRNRTESVQSSKRRMGDRIVIHANDMYDDLERMFRIADAKVEADSAAIAEEQVRRF